MPSSRQLKSAQQLASALIYVLALLGNCVTQACCPKPLVRSNATDQPPYTLRPWVQLPSELLSL